MVDQSIQFRNSDAQSLLGNVGEEGLGGNGPGK